MIKLIDLPGTGVGLFRVSNILLSLCTHCMQLCIHTKTAGLEFKFVRAQDVYSTNRMRIYTLRAKSYDNSLDTVLLENFRSRNSLY